MRVAAFKFTLCKRSDGNPPQLLALDSAKVTIVTIEVAHLELARQFSTKIRQRGPPLAIAASNPTIERVATRLHQIFDGLITANGSGTADQDQTERLFRSRAYMALALLDATEANPVDAAAAITDGGDDGGIDCVS